MLHGFTEADVRLTINFTGLKKEYEEEYKSVIYKMAVSGRNFTLGIPVFTYWDRHGLMQ